MGFVMGMKVEGKRDEVWQAGTILGVHEGDCYDILYEDGEGEMQKSGQEIRLVEASKDSAGDSGSGSVSGITGKKSSSIGWNPDAFGGGQNENLDAAATAVPAAPPVQAASTTTTTTDSSKAKFSPQVGDKVECKDFASKEWKAARVVAMDEELQTYDLKYSDDKAEAKGVPINLLRMRQRRKKSRTATKGGGEQEQAPSNKIEKISQLCQGFNDNQLDFIIDVVKGLKANFVPP